MERQEGEKKRKGRSTVRLLGLFAAAGLLMASGCDDQIEICYDEDNDLLCDDDLSEVDTDSYVVINGKKVGYVKSSAVEDFEYDRKSRVSSGSRGGIGKSSYFSGG